MRRFRVGFSGGGVLLMRSFLRAIATARLNSAGTVRITGGVTGSNLTKVGFSPGVFDFINTTTLASRGIGPPDVTGTNLFVVRQAFFPLPSPSAVCCCKDGP